MPMFLRGIDEAPGRLSAREIAKVRGSARSLSRFSRRPRRVVAARVGEKGLIDYSVLCGVLEGPAHPPSFQLPDTAHEGLHVDGAPGDCLRAKRTDPGG